MKSVFHIHLKSAELGEVGGGGEGHESYQYLRGGITAKYNKRLREGDQLKFVVSKSKFSEPPRW